MADVNLEFLTILHRTTRLRPKTRSPNVRLRNQSLIVSCLIVLLLGGSPFCGSTLSAKTLQESTEAATRAFTSSEFSQAHRQFENIEAVFAGEPEYEKQELQMRLLPLRGYSALRCNNLEVAATFFQLLLDAERLSEETRQFSIYQLGVTHLLKGDLKNAAVHFRLLERQINDLNLSVILKLQESFALERSGALEGALNAISESDSQQRGASETLQQITRSRRLRLLIADEQFETAQHLLQELKIGDLESSTALSIARSALQLADHYTNKSEHQNALFVYRFILPKANLIESLQAAQQQLSSARLPLRIDGARAFIYRDFYDQLQREIEADLAWLRTNENFDATIYLQKGRTYLQADRPREAFVLFDELGKRKHLLASISKQSNYLAILALLQANQFEQLTARVDAFAQRFPDDELVDDARHLAALGLQKDGDLEGAIELLDTLIGARPQDSRVPFWLFTKGYTQTLAFSDAAARTSFQQGLAAKPNTQLSAKLRLWIGLTYFFEEDFNQAITRLMALEAELGDNPLIPEIRYRLATIKYALQAYAETLELCAQFLTEHPGHLRTPAIKALRGDAYTGLSDYDEALSAYATISTDSINEYNYGIFQRARILRDLGNHSKLQRLLKDYINEARIYGDFNVAEAIYQLGQSYLAIDKPDLAVEIYEKAFEFYGDDRYATNLQPMLTAFLQQLQLDKQGGALIWLKQQRNEASKAERWTWFAHLSLQLAKTADEKVTTTNQSLLNIHENVPLSGQPPESLARVGLHLHNLGYTLADDYASEILQHFADHAASGEARIIKAETLVNENEESKARRQLESFLEATPRHPLMSRARLLYADVLYSTGLHAAAITQLEQILSDRAQRGLPHVRSLSKLAEFYALSGAHKEAIAYYQRIYTLYPAFTEHASGAYVASAQLFEQIGDLKAAQATIDELKSRPQLINTAGADYLETLGKRIKVSLNQEGSENKAARAKSLSIPVPKEI